MTRQQAKAGDLLGKMRKVTLHETPAQGDQIPAPVEAQPSRNGKRTVRFTLDLSPEQHRFLKRFAFDAEVDGITVLRTLLRLLETDPALAARVRERLESRY